MCYRSRWPNGFFPTFASGPFSPALYIRRGGGHSLSHRRLLPTFVSFKIQVPRPYVRPPGQARFPPHQSTPIFTTAGHRAIYRRKTSFTSYFPHTMEDSESIVTYGELLRLSHMYLLMEKSLYCQDFSFGVGGGWCSEISARRVRLSLPKSFKLHLCFQL